MSWSKRYNYLAEEFKVSNHDILQFYKNVATWSNDSILIATVLLVFDSIDSSYNFKFPKANQFLSICKQNFDDQNCNELFNILQNFINLLSSENANIDDFMIQINNSSMEEFKDFEFQCIIQFIQYKSEKNILKSSNDQVINKIQIKVKDELKNTNGLTPYINFLQLIKYSILNFQLEYYKSKSSWSSYLLVSFQLLNEAIFNITTLENQLICQWYSSKTKILSVIPLFVKAFLLEPYGFFKQSILEAIKFYFSNKEKLNTQDSFLTLGNNLTTEILKQLATEKFFIFSINDNIYDYIKSIICDNDINIVRIISINLIELNIVFASHKFYTVKISTLNKLFNFNSNEFDSLTLIDIVLDLLKSKKLIVKINQYDEILTFPLLNENSSQSLDLMFSQTLPRVLERDWNNLIES